MRTHLFLALAVVTALLAFPSFASAAVTSTAITSPAAFSYPMYDSDTSTGSMEISGTATAADGDVVDIKCFGRPSGTVVARMATNVVVTGGAFSASGLSNNVYNTCTLRAVPAGTTPSDLSPFTGPGIGFSGKQTYSYNGKLSDYYYFLAQKSGSFDYGSAFSCGIGDSYLNDPSTYAYTTYVFYCNQYFRSEITPGSSSLQVDGRNAFGAGGSGSTTLSSLAAYQPATFSVTQDATTGNSTITESEVLMGCPANSWPPTTGNCSDLTPLPVRLDRTIVQDQNGLRSAITDKFVSTDGNSHTLSAGYWQWFCVRRGSCSTADHGYTFPGHDQIVDPANGTHVSGPFPAGSTTWISDPTKADGDLASGRGAIKFSQAADSVDFNNETSYIVRFNDRTIPASGSFDLKASFYNAYTQSQLQALVDLVDPSPDSAPAQPTASSKLNLVGRSKASAMWDSKKHRVRLNTGQLASCPAGGGSCTVTTKLNSNLSVHGRTKAYKVTYSMTVRAGETVPVKYLVRTGGRPGSGSQLYSGGGVRVAYRGTMKASVAGSDSVNRKLKFSVTAPKRPQK